MSGLAELRLKSTWYTLISNTFVVRIYILRITRSSTLTNVLVWMIYISYVHFWKTSKITVQTLGWMPCLICFTSLYTRSDTQFPGCNSSLSKKLISCLFCQATCRTFCLFPLKLPDICTIKYWNNANIEVILCNYSNRSFSWINILVISLKTYWHLYS